MAISSKSVSKCGCVRGEGNTKRAGHGSSSQPNYEEERRRVPCACHTGNMSESKKPSRRFGSEGKRVS